jgi:tetraprenyl-beta-curcumene synthase
VRASTLNHASLARGFAQAAERYWLHIYPQVRRELSYWQRRASQIPDPALRMIALDGLHSKRGNLEGAAAFATFSPSAARASVVRASVALQAIYDYADTLMEQPHDDPVANARQLHLALRLALHEPGAPHGDYYAHHSACDDNRYLRDLVDVCRAAIARLPSFGIVRELVRLNIERIIRYQTLIDRPSAFAAWATGETPRDVDLRWWETGAACGSSMAVFALIATAANIHLLPGEAQSIEHAYFPWIGALHTLLDSLIDRPDDLASGQHSLLGHYDSARSTAERMRFIAREATRRAEQLPGGPSHALILAGMTSQYLSTPVALLPHARAARESIIDAVGALSTPTMAVFAARQRSTQLRIYVAKASVGIKCLQ